MNYLSAMLCDSLGLVWTCYSSFPPDFPDKEHGTLSNTEVVDVLNVSSCKKIFPTHRIPVISSTFRPILIPVVSNTGRKNPKDEHKVFLLHLRQDT